VRKSGLSDKIIQLDRESLEELRRIRQRAPSRRSGVELWLEPGLLAPAVVVGMFAFFFANSLSVFVLAAAIAFAVLLLARYVSRLFEINKENNILLRELLKERETQRVRQS
jgi:hypothetical protein